MSCSSTRTAPDDNIPPSPIATSEARTTQESTGFLASLPPFSGYRSLRGGIALFPTKNTSDLKKKHCRWMKFGSVRLLNPPANVALCVHRMDDDVPLVALFGQPCPVKCKMAFWFGLPLYFRHQVNACLDLIDKGDNITKPEPSVVVIEGAHGTGKVSYRVPKCSPSFMPSRL